MRVSGEEFIRAWQVRQVGRTVNSSAAGSIATAPARGTSATQMDISTEARDIQRVVGLVAREPEIREDIVAGLRARIESGTYRVTGEEIGEMMLRRLLADHVR